MKGERGWRFLVLRREKKEKVMKFKSLKEGNLSSTGSVRKRRRDGVPDSRERRKGGSAYVLRKEMNCVSIY